ncbi:hypothetical protein D3C80_803750 [compost metagenome]
MALQFNLIESKRVLEIGRNNKVFVRSHYWDKAHARQIARKFQAWDRQGWPPKE